MLVAIVPVTYQRFHDRQFKSTPHYGFAVGDLVVPIVLREVAKVVMEMPIGFTASQNTFLPVAVLGFGSRLNTFVTTEGQWSGNYVPALLRAHPFSLGSTERGELLLCIDDKSSQLEFGVSDGSGLFTDEAKPFYSGDGQPLPWLESLVGFLRELHNDRARTQAASQCLADAGLLKPWSVQVQTPQGVQEQSLSGLFSVDKQALADLHADKLVKLRDSGALLLAHAHALSVSHLAELAKQANALSQGEVSSGSAGFSVVLDEPGLSFLGLEDCDMDR